MKFAYLAVASLFAVASAQTCMSLPAVASMLEGSYCSELPGNPYGATGDATLTIASDKFTIHGYNLENAPAGIKELTFDGCVTSANRFDVPGGVGVDVTFTLSNPFTGTVGPICTTFVATGSITNPSVRLLALDNTACVAHADATRTTSTDRIRVIDAVEAVGGKQCSGAGWWTVSIGGVMMVMGAVMKLLTASE